MIFDLEKMNGIQANQLLFARNHETHLKEIKELGHGVRTLTDLIERLEKKQDLGEGKN